MQCTTHYDAPRSQAPRTYRALGADGHDGKNSDHLKPTVNGPLAVLNRAIHHGMKPDIVLFYITEGGDIAAANVSYSHDQRDEIFVPFIIESSSMKPKYLNEPVHVENMDDLDPHTHFNEMDIVPSIDPAVQISMRSHLFALIIGIDKYKHSSSTLPNLSGAVRDAKAIKTYLEDRMNVPSSRIRTLLNEDATRRAILDEVVNLKTNNAIIKNDPILIYYAGHGAEVASPEDWEAGGKDAKIQMIIPHDYVEGEKDPQAPHGIPDRTIAILLDNLADAKGNNITVIFDSCFAGSGTRAIHEDSSARGFGARRPVPPNLDRKILPVTRVIGPCPGFATHGLRSHVFLAACRSGETAHESHEGGDFTVALLRTLQNLGPSEQLSYKALVQRLAPLLSSQNPVCEGVYQNWVLFSPRKGSTRRTYALHKVVVVNGVITMQAGSAHGVSEGSEYAIHEHNTINSLTLGRFIASQPDTFETRLNYTNGFHGSSIPSLAYAVQTYASRSPDDSALKVYVPEDFPFVPLHEALVEASRHCPPGHRTFLTTPTRSEADVGLEHNGSHRVRVALLKERDPSNSLKYASIHLTLDDPTQRTIRVLRSAAHFYWYLRHHTHKGKAFQSKVLMSCFQLQECATIFDNQEQLCLKPSPGGRNIIVDDRIDITVNENDKYGFELINTTKVSLYPYLFYFNKSDFSIEPLYIPSTGAEPPLAAGDGRLTIGYGAGGASPISWSVSNGQNLEDGSLKLIVATTYMELSDMPQASEDSAGHKLKRTSLRPEPSHVPRTPVLQRPREMVLVQSPRHDLWWEVTIPVVQRRPPHG
ncbi:caspase domain-containing protein [Amylostereum chailletii]|nr:caspase domain-containing protein [Amylostereum chailletii]